MRQCQCGGNARRRGFTLAALEPPESAINAMNQKTGAKRNASQPALTAHKGCLEMASRRHRTASSHQPPSNNIYMLPLLLMRSAECMTVRRAR